MTARLSALRAGRTITPEEDTDHYLVKTKVRERIVLIQKTEGVNPKKWDVRKLQESKEIKQENQRKIEERIRENREM
jgi:hypothetical protein